MPNRTHLQGLSAMPEYKACLPACLRCPYSVDPEAVLRLIVEGQFTYRREGANSKPACCYFAVPTK